MQNDITPEITVILCVKNGGNFLHQCIESILNQTYSNFEFLIIQNGSTDNSNEIIESFDDKRIKLYKTNITQLSFNLNYGLNQAKGIYIARIDADDIAHPQRFEKQIGIIQEFNYDVVGSNINCINEQGDYKKTIYFPENNEKIRRNILFKSVLAHPSIMVKKDTLLSASGYLGGRYAQDYDLWLRLMRNKAIQFYNIQESLIQYRVHLNQTKGNKNSYGEVAGYFLKESIYTWKLIYIVGSIIYFIKALILGISKK